MTLTHHSQPSLLWTKNANCSSEGSHIFLMKLCGLVFTQAVFQRQPDSPAREDGHPQMFLWILRPQQSYARNMKWITFLSQVQEYFSLPEPRWGEWGRLVISSSLAGSNWLLCSFGLGTIWKTFPRPNFILSTDRCPTLTTHQTRPTVLKPSWPHEWKGFVWEREGAKCLCTKYTLSFPSAVQWGQPFPTANCLWVQGCRFYHKVAPLKSTGQWGTWGSGWLSIWLLIPDQATISQLMGLLPVLGSVLTTQSLPGFSLSAPPLPTQALSQNK